MLGRGLCWSVIVPRIDKPEPASVEVSDIAGGHGETSRKGDSRDQSVKSLKVTPHALAGDSHIAIDIRRRLIEIENTASKTSCYQGGELSLEFVASPSAR